jgi:hypothetical protein
MCLRHIDQDFKFESLNHNNLPEILVRLQEKGYLSPFLLEQFLAYKSGGINKEENIKLFPGQEKGIIKIFVKDIDEEESVQLRFDLDFEDLGS